MPDDIADNSHTYYQQQGRTVDVGVETREYKILGKAFLYKNQRFSGLLGRNEKRFLALTNVKVFSLRENKVLFEKEHLMINKDHIVLAWEQ